LDNKHAFEQSIPRKSALDTSVLGSMQGYKTPRNSPRFKSRTVGLAKPPKAKLREESVRKDDMEIVGRMGSYRPPRAFAGRYASSRWRRSTLPQRALDFSEDTEGKENIDDILVSTRYPRTLLCANAPPKKETASEDESMEERGVRIHSEWIVSTEHGVLSRLVHFPQTLPGLTIEHPAFGKVKWLKPVVVHNWKELANAVQFRSTSVQVLPNARPPFGVGLNVPMRVSIYNLSVPRGVQAKISVLRQECKRTNTHFVSFTNRTWTFDVPGLIS